MPIHSEDFRAAARRAAAGVLEPGIPAIGPQSFCRRVTLPLKVSILTRALPPPT